MPAQYALRSTLFPTHDPLYWDARKRAFDEIEWFETALREAMEAIDIGYDEISEDDLESWHGAAEAAEWLLENPNAVAILKAQERLEIAREWAAWRPIIERRAINLHRNSGAGEGA